MSEITRPQIAIISNEPTPYRLAVLRRIAAELPQVTTHNIFTHTVSDPSQPWAVKIEPALNPVYFADLHLQGNGSSLGRQRKLFEAIRSFLERQQVRLVVLLGYNDLTRLKLIAWAKGAGVPLLVTGDSNVFGEGRGSLLKRWLKRAVLKRVLGNAAGLMPMGVCGRAFFRSFADHNLPTFLFPYEPDYAQLTNCPEERREKFMAARKFDAQRRRLLYVGRLTAVKRVADLIDAFARIAPHRKEWDLVIAGDGELRDALVKRVPTELKDRVKWLGFLQGDELVPCYHSCDVFVLPSEYEPWGVVINEAAACGLAIVATEVVGAAAELVRHQTNGMIVRPRDPAGLAAALEQMTDPHVCQWMRKASPGVLREWRKAADPVDGLRSALRHFKVIE